MEQDQGAGQSLSIDGDRQIVDDLSFRFVNESTWLDLTDELSTSHGPSFYYKISNRRAVSFNSRANLSNRPQYEIDNYDFNLVYRQNLHKEWLYYELIPSINFSRERSFHSHLGITGKVEFFVGSF